MTTKCACEIDDDEDDEKKTCQGGCQEAPSNGVSAKHSTCDMYIYICALGLDGKFLTKTNK